MSATRRPTLKLVPKPSEAQIQKQILDYLALLPGITAVHYPAGGADPQHRRRMAVNGTPNGVPDILLFRSVAGAPATVAFMEVKRPGGRLSPAQLLWRAWCADNNAPHALVTSADAAEAALREWRWL